MDKHSGRFDVRARLRNELRPLRQVENDACEQARGPLVQLKRRADVRREGLGTSTAGPSSHLAEQDREDWNIWASVDRSLIPGGLDDHLARLFVRFLTDQGERRAMEVSWGNRLKPGDYNTSAAFRTLLPMLATIGSAAGSTRG